MNTKKLAIYIITPVLGVAAVTAVTLPNVVSPISPTGAAQMERTLVLDSSTNEMFTGQTGVQSTPTNTASGNAITFSANYEFGDEHSGSTVGWATHNNSYTAHAKYNTATGYRFYFTHSEAFKDLLSITVNFTPENSDCKSEARLYTSNSPFKAYPSGDGSLFSANTVNNVATFDLSGSVERYFAITFAGQSLHGNGDYYLDITSITISYSC